MGEDEKGGNMRHEWKGNEASPGGWAVFTSGTTKTRIYFNEFADYWRVVGIIDHEVKLRIGKTIDAIRATADRLEEEI